jgi:regulator of cell morphogenesis and NO signaling
MWSSVMNFLDVHSNVGQLVRDRPARARVFERLGIDYCCGGKRPLDEVCRDRGLDLDRVLDELAGEDGRALAAEPVDWSAAPMSELADHIEATHHAYLRRELPRLDGLMEKVVAAHAARHAELWDLLAVFRGLKRELESHMLKEELVLFPMVRQLQQATERPRFHCGSVANPIAVMEHEHDSAGVALARLRALTGGYAAPADACHTYRALLDGLAELEADLHLHIHKENNILFPRAHEAEAALATGSGN